MSMENVPMKKIDEVTWEIPTSYKKGMKVPARLFLTPELKKGVELRVVEQITNVATLPGIVKYAIALPDTHAGYGFPIGGVAAMDVKEGVISPGGVGFDINCLPGDTLILHSLGYRKTIKEFESDWRNTELCVFNTSENSMETASIAYFLKKRDTEVYTIRTYCGYTIKATPDHPLLTPDGMIETQNLHVGDKLAIYPFEGIDYEEPKNEILLTEEDILKLDLGFDNQSIVKELKKRDLLPLTLNNPKLPYLLSIIGFILGDGTVIVSSTTEGKKGYITFYGKPEDLDEIREDVRKLGWSPSKIYHRTKKAPFFKNGYVKDIISEEYSFKQVSRSFVSLIAALGFPVGSRVSQDWVLPEWLMKVPKWMKRLFLASLQGADMSTPTTLTSNEGTFYMPYIKIHRKESYEQSGLQYIKQLQQLYNEFNINTSISEPVLRYTNEEGTKSYAITIFIKGDSQNLIKLFSTINFKYNKRKQWLANAATVYLKLKEKEIESRNTARKEIIKLKEENKGITEISKLMNDKYGVNRRFVERTIYDGVVDHSRPSKAFFSFEAFLGACCDNLEESGVVWDKIVSIEKEDFDDYVYDFTINHESHNFVANSIIVSNCGVRMLSTHLSESEVRPKISELINKLFRAVPAGVGVKSTLRLNDSQFNEVLETGATWCLENGYASKEDVERIESEGHLPHADASKVSQRAKQRGRSQLGTLGSGNHYLEIQVLEEGDLFDPEIGKELGLTHAKQISVMIHCGSRGLGHQVASDYLKTCVQAMDKYKIPVLDQELASVPITSKEGEDYFAAMNAAANMAFANRQIITHKVREVFEEVFKKDSDELGLKLIYDVAHNIAKMEEHEVDGKKRKLVIHRKGATRGFPPGHPEIPKAYQKIGQPVIIGGSMETGSYLLVGTQKSMEITFGSTAHGAGRVMSRAQARRVKRGEEVQRQLSNKGIYLKGASYKGIAEEGGHAYKDIDAVIHALKVAGISHPVARLRPIGNIKG